MPNDTTLRLFEIIYREHHDKSMSFIQEELYKACRALMEIDRKLKLDCAEHCESCSSCFDESGEGKVNGLTHDDLAIKNPRKIKESIGDDFIICCICGQTFQSLGAHLRRTHGISAKQYCEVCGLPEDTVLMSNNYYKRAQQYAMKAFQSLPKNRKKDTMFTAEDFEELNLDGDTGSEEDLDPTAVEL